VAEKAPAFQFYPKDFLSDEHVMQMSLTERGAYITLLSVCWLQGSLPLETDALARLLGLPLPRFTKLWENSVIRQCFTVVEGRLRHKRLDLEREKQETYRRRQSDNGGKGGRPAKGAEISTGVVENKHPGHETCLDSNYASHSQKQAENRSVRKPTGFENESQKKLSNLQSPISHTEPVGVLVDDDRSELAAEFLRRYPAIYAKRKHGASYRVLEARDHPAAIELVSMWPDLDYLCKMLEIFLLRPQFAPMNEPGTPRQFKAKASECDSLLRQHGHRPKELAS